VIVDPDREPAPGSFVVARFDDVQEATFKQLVEDAGRRYLKPLNPRYPMIPIDGNVILCGTWIQTIIDSE
jgi:SOS-response transcriptional repressor LexA